MNPASTSTQVEQQIELARWSSGNALLVGFALTLACVYAVVWLYRHEARGQLGRTRRVLLAAIRCSVLLGLGLIGLEPVLARYLRQRVQASTLVLLDESASMALADRYADPERQPPVVARGGVVGDEPPARARLVEAVVNGEWLERLGRSGAVKLLGFGERVRPLATTSSAGADADSPDGGARPAVRLDPSGRCTNFSEALRQALDAAGGAPVSAVITFSDGNFNEGEPGELAASRLRAKGIPWHIVGVGDPSPPANVRITDISGPRMAFRNDPIEIIVHVSVDGPIDRDLDVTLEERRRVDTDAEPVVIRQTARAAADGSIAPLRFTRTLSRPGEYVYSARAAVGVDEAVASDNIRELMPPVRVLDEKMRVLMVASGPTFDYRYLTRLLIREKAVDLSCWLQSADENAVREGSTVIDHLPTGREELFAYDVVLLIDPDPTALPPDWAGQVAALVSEQGGGVLYAAGRAHGADFVRSRSAAPLVELMPVVFDADAELLMNELGIYQRTAWPLKPPDDGPMSPVLRLADDAEANRRAWSGLEGVYWHFPVKREKAAAMVLLRHSNPKMVNAAGPHVLLATQYAGAGRAAFLGFGDSWRWRRSGEVVFERFWIQFLRFLAEGRLAGARSRGQLLPDRDQCTVGDTVSVTARLLSEKFEPLVKPSVDMVLSRDGREQAVVPLTPLAEQAGYYQGRFLADRAGGWRLQVRLADSGGRTAVVSQDVVVSEPNLETEHPAMEREALRQFATQTGGRYFDIDEAAVIPDIVQDRSQTVVTPDRPRPLWDNAYVFALLAGLLSVEWAMRRWARLL